MQRTKPHTLQFDPIRSHPTTPCPVPNNTPRHMNEAKVKRTNIFQNLLQGSKVKGQSMLSNVRIRGGHSRLTETHERRTRSFTCMMRYTMHTNTRKEREVMNWARKSQKQKIEWKTWRTLHYEDRAGARLASPHPRSTPVGARCLTLLLKWCASAPGWF